MVRRGGTSRTHCGFASSTYFSQRRPRRWIYRRGSSSIDIVRCFGFDSFSTYLSFLQFRYKNEQSVSFCVVVLLLLRLHLGRAVSVCGLLVEIVHTRLART